MFRIIILVLALGSGGIAAWIAMGATSNPASEATAVVEPEVTRMHEVLVADTELMHGTQLQESHLRWLPWTAGEVPAVFISREIRPNAPEDLKGTLVRSGFVAGEPIREDKLAQPGAGFLSGQLLSGKRAIAVRVTAESTAGGFILPNDRVDLVHTAVRSGSSGEGGEVVSRTILSNVKVLAVDQTTTEGGDGTTLVGKTATLEVDPEQIATITAAEASGTIALALRAAADRDSQSEIVAEEKRSRTVRVFTGNAAKTVEVPSF